MGRLIAACELLESDYLDAVFFVGGLTFGEVEVEASCERFAEFADGLFVLHGSIVPYPFHLCTVRENDFNFVFGFDASFSELFFDIGAYSHTLGAYLAEASYPVTAIGIGVGVSLPIIACYLP